MASARFLIVPPMPASRSPSPESSQPADFTSFATCLRSAFSSFEPGLSLVRNSSLTRTAPSGHEADRLSLRPLIFITCTLPPPMSIPKPSSSVVEFAIAR